MFFKKKKTGPVEIKLADDQFCCIVEEKAEDVSHKYCVLASSDNYNLLYRDGRFMGMPQPYGGSIYPFSQDPTKPGSKQQKKQYPVRCVRRQSMHPSVGKRRKRSCIPAVPTP